MNKKQFWYEFLIVCPSKNLLFRAIAPDLGLGNDERSLSIFISTKSLK
ncbi:hypothetical protein [Aliterella atlantica]|nr:hypothetical protein [Aliterella atlantica]